MPIKPENKDRYPKTWRFIRWKIIQRANNRCEWCGAENGEPHPETGSKVVLTVMHLDHTPENCADENLKAACQKCHNSYDADHRAETRKKTREENLKADGQLDLYSTEEVIPDVSGNENHGKIVEAEEKELDIW